MDLDAEVRAAAFGFLAGTVDPVHRTISWQGPTTGFGFHGRHRSPVGNDRRTDPPRDPAAYFRM